MDTTTKVPGKSPKRYRVGLFFLSMLFSLLLIWLGTFVLNDIDRTRPPEVDAPELLMQQSALLAKRAELQDTITEAEAQLKFLKDTTSSSQTTLNQLLQLRDTEDGVERAQVFDEAQRVFLRNQTQVLDVIERIAALKTEQRANERAVDDVQRELGVLRQEVYQRHRTKQGFAKCLFLAPICILGIVFFAKKRRSPYVAMIHAYNVAAAWLLYSTIYDHFPREFFKYILILSAIAIVISLMAFLIRQVSKPNATWLLRRNREAYQANQCPVCRYPFATVSTQEALVHHPGKRMLPMTRENYACPSCGTQLFEPCDQCGKNRYSLLPHCPECGATHPKPETS